MDGRVKPGHDELSNLKPMSFRGASVCERARNPEIVSDELFEIPGPREERVPE
jgi:hypothetical protein